VRVALAIAAALLAGCSTTNYTDPAGPLFEGGSSVPPPARGELRMVSFNVEYALRIDAAVAGLRTPPLQGADVVALQEMDAPGVQRIASALGMNYVYFPASVHPRTKRDFGNAILSPWPLDAPRKVLLPHRSLIYNQARTATTARVHVGTRAVQVYSLHFGAPRGTSEGRRRDQADTVIRDAAGVAGPVAILGDVNSRAIGERFVAAGYRWLTADAGPTAGPWALDHVFVRGLPGRSEAGVAREVDDASDHLPVWAVLHPEGGSPGQP
jgi:endonuclease/exonuclease/phosphatase family metal-dependent hydrolase